MDKAIAFDFDGVIIDQGGEFVRSVRKTSEELQMTINSKNINEQIRKGRKFVQNPDDYYIVMKIIEETPAINFKDMNQKMFDAYREKFGYSPVFETKLNEVRKAFMIENKKAWLGFHKPFPNIADAIRQLRKEFVIFLATAKRRIFVMDLLNHYKIRDLFDADKIFTGDTSKDKTIQMKDISRRFNIPLNKILFIEDMVENARAIRMIGVNTAVAEWGYSDERQRKEIMDEGVVIIENRRIYDQIKVIMDKI